MTIHLPTDEKTLAAYLDGLDASVERSDEAVRWALYCRYKKERGPDVASAEAERAALLLDPRLPAVLDRWSGQVAKGLTQRRLDLWRKLATAAAIRDVPAIRDLRTELNATIVSYQPQIGGEVVSRTAVRELLRTAPDPEQRRRAWLAFGGLATAIEDRVRELIRRRNRHAQALGYRSYVDLSLELDGLSRPHLEDLSDQIDELTRPVYEGIVREGAATRGIARVEPWDVAFVTDRSNLIPDARFPQAEMLPRLDIYRRRIGVSDGLPIRIEFIEVPFGGLTNYIKIPSDMRILMNAADSHGYYVTLFHEYGHALHNASISQPSFILQKESGPYAESTAQVSAAFASHPSWLEEAAGLSGEETVRFREARLAEWVVRLRELLAVAAFERQVYDDPEADLDALLARAEARYLLVESPRERRWAANPYYSLYPIYLHNYVIADVVAAAVHASLRRDLGDPYGNPRTFEWLAERLYVPGATLPWRNLLTRVTGADLDPAPLAAAIKALGD